MLHFLCREMYNFPSIKDTAIISNPVSTMASLQSFKSHSNTFKLEKTWKIDRFSDLMAYNEPMGTYFSNCQGDLCSFCLEIYPDGDDKESYKHVGLWFGVNFPTCTSDGVNSAFGDVQMSIIDTTGAKCNTKEYSVKHDPENEFWGDAKFVEHDKLLNADSNCLHDDGNTTEMIVIHFEGIISILYTDSNQLGADLQTLLESQEHSDVTFIIGADELKAHKAVLSARSPVFAAMFEHTNTKEAKEGRVTIEDLSKEAFQELLKYLYTGQIPAKEQVTDDLLVASDKYQVDLLKSVCEELLSTSLTVSNVVRLLNLADMHSAPVLKANCIDFITENAFQVTQTEEWEKLAEAKPKLNLEVVPIITKAKSMYPNQPKISFNCEPMTVNVEHTWRIADFNYFLLQNDPEVFPIVKSAPFAAHGHEQIVLQMKIPLKNMTYGQIGVSLEVELGVDIKDLVSIDGTFSVLDKNHKQCESKKSTWNGKNSGEMPQVQFQLGTLLYDRESPFLVNKKLVIQFQGTITCQGINHQKHLDVLSEDMDNLLKSGKHSDTSFYGGSINAHKCILWARSQRIKELLNYPYQVKLPEPQMTASLMQTLLKHIYTGAIPEKELLDYDLMIASKKYKMHVLEYACVRQLESFLSIDTVIDVLLKAENENKETKMKPKLLKSKCIAFILANANDVMNSHSWKKMEANATIQGVKLMSEIMKAFANIFQPKSINKLLYG